MAVKTIEDLFIHELSDAYSAEKQMTRSLPKMARAAQDPQLAEAFERHLEETQNQVLRIDQLAEQTGIKLKRIKCVAMEGLIEEGKDLIDEIDKGPVLDAAQIGDAPKVEHDEIASYTALMLMAKQLGLAEAVQLLGETLGEEKATDEKLGQLAAAAKVDEALRAA